MVHCLWGVCPLQACAVRKNQRVALSPRNYNPGRNLRLLLLDGVVPARPGWYLFRRGGRQLSVHLANCKVELANMTTLCVSQTAHPLIPAKLST